MKMSEKTLTLMQNITVGCGLISFANLDIIIDVYISIITIACGTASLFQIIKNIIKRYKK
jgi:hypothetical protein